MVETVGEVPGASGLAVAADGTLYVVDAVNHRVVSVDGSGEVSIVAGTGEMGFEDGERATFSNPAGLALRGRDLFVADFFNDAIRRIDLDTGVVNTVAGGPEAGFVDGSLAEARFDRPVSVALGSEPGVLYVADAWNNAIRTIDLNERRVTTVAGRPEAGTRDGSAGADGEARFFRPWDVAFAGDGRLFVTDSENHTIRRIAASTVTTVAGRPGIPGYREGEGARARFRTPVCCVAGPVTASVAGRMA